MGGVTGFSTIAAAGVGVVDDDVEVVGLSVFSSLYPTFNTVLAKA